METFQTMFSWFYLKAQQYNPFASDQDVEAQMLLINIL